MKNKSEAIVTEDKTLGEIIHCPMCSKIEPGMTILTNTAGDCLDCGRHIKEPYKPEPEKQKRELPRFDDLGPGAPPFEEYFNLKIDYIKKIQSMLAESLDDHPALMDKQVREAEAHQASMKSILSWADSYLDVAEHLSLIKMPSRASDFTDLDRQKALAAAVVRQRRFRDVVRGIVESMQTRISYAQSRLRAFVSAEGQKFQ